MPQVYNIHIIFDSICIIYTLISEVKLPSLLVQIVPNMSWWLANISILITNIVKLSRTYITDWSFHNLYSYIIKIINTNP